VALHHGLILGDEPNVRFQRQIGIKSPTYRCCRVIEDFAFARTTQSGEPSSQAFRHDSR